MLRQIEPAVQSIFGRRNTIHPSGREPVQPKGKDQDEENSQPPGRHRERHRREIGHAPVELAPDPGRHAHTDQQTDRGRDHRRCRQEQHRVRQPLLDDIGDLRAPLRGSQRTRIAQVEGQHTPNLGRHAPPPRFIETVELFQLRFTGGNRRFQLSGILDGLRLRLSEPAQFLVHLRGKQTVRIPGCSQ